jgi:acetyl esterase
MDTIIASGEPPIHQRSIEDARAAPGMLAELFGTGPEVASVRDIAIPGPGGDIDARVYEPEADPPGTIVYYHGGGWVIGTLDAWDAACRLLAVESGCRLVSVDYRLAPEHPFPAAADDAYAALAWVAGNLAAGKPLVVAGDSAGGNLAAVAALRARDEGGPSIALQVLVYPVTDHDFTTDSYTQYGEAPLFLGKDSMAWFWAQYVPNEAERAAPHASPLRASDHSGLPAAYVVIAEYDPLRDDGLAYADKLEAAGVPVSVRLYDDQMHAFFTMVNLMDAANAAVAEAGQAIRSAVEAF